MSEYNLRFRMYITVFRFSAVLSLNADIILVSYPARNSDCEVPMYLVKWLTHLGDRFRPGLQTVGSRGDGFVNEVDQFVAILAVRPCVLAGLTRVRTAWGCY